jgi:ATP-dependent helicase/nuclease subunit B
MGGGRPGLGGEDHPQYRLARVADGRDFAPVPFPEWAPSLAPPSATRNKLVSLALRPAPVTDQWRAEGPRFRAFGEALRHVTYLEAPNPQTRRRRSLWDCARPRKTGFRAALVSPDRNLTRQVAARSIAGTSRPMTAPVSRLG